MCEEDKKEIERLKSGIYAVVSGLVTGHTDMALTLARTTMYGGNVNNPIDLYNLGEAPKDRLKGAAA